MKYEPQFDTEYKELFNSNTKLEDKYFIKRIDEPKYCRKCKLGRCISFERRMCWEKY